MSKLFLGETQLRAPGRNSIPPMSGMVERLELPSDPTLVSEEERFIELVCRRADERKDAINSTYEPSAWSRK